MKLLLVLLLAPSVSGVFLRSGSESHTLRAHSEALHTQIQAYADRLELNPADVAHYLTNPSDTVEFLRALRLCAPCKKYQRFGEDDSISNSNWNRCSISNSNGNIIFLGTGLPLTPLF